MAGGGHGSSEEPDLTAMLDVVMQLLMYFILCVHFDKEEVSEDIMLPNSQQAKAAVKGEGDLLFMNVNKDGKVEVLGEKDPMDVSQTEYWLDKRAMDARDASKSDKINTAIVLRADRGASYGQVFEIMQSCKKKGFTKFKVRAIVTAGG